MDMQSIVLRGLLRKKSWFSLQTIVTDDVITNADARKVMGIIRGLHASVDGDISATSVRLDIESTYKLNESLRESLLATVSDMESAADLTISELEPVVRKYVSREKLMQGAMFLTSHLDDPEFDHEKLITMFEAARDAGAIFDPSVEEYTKAGSPDKIKRSGIIPTSLSVRLDKAIGGGLAVGELVVYMAPGNRGKTSAMVKTGCGAARMGMNTLIIGLEINANQYFGLIDKDLTGLRSEDLVANPFLALQKREKLPGDVWVKDWSAGVNGQKATVADIRNLLIALRRQDKRVDLLIVDQWELLGSTGFHKEDRQMYRENGIRMRMLGNEFGFPVLSGWQTNRAGYKAHLIEEEHIGEDISVMKTCDHIVTLNQNKEERRDKRMRLGLLKQRTGDDYPVINCFWNTSRMEFRDRTDQDIEDNLSIEGVKDEEEQGDAGQGAEGSAGQESASV